MDGGVNASDDIRRDVIVERVARAARNRHEADAEYRAAILHARAHGLSLTVIGRAAGVTKWGVKHTIQQAQRDGAA